MKPTVITSGSNSGNGSNPQVIPQNTKNMGSTADGVGPESNNGAPSHGYSNSRDFPNFQRMGFDPDDDALFSDARLRSRLGRMTDPFSRFDARKRGNVSNGSPHGSYFDDDADFFPSEFGSLGGRRRVIQPDTRFFENIPSEFRQYIPEGFGFHSRLDGAGAPQSQQTRSPAQGHTHPQQQEQNPQYYQTFAPQGNGSMQSNEKNPQSKTLCDAAIQTEDLGQSQVDGLKTDNLNQHGLRNTVDLGIGSPSENDENRGQRAHSAPPQDQGKQNFGTSPTQSTQQAFRSQGTQQNSPPTSQAQQRAHASNTNAQPQFPKSYYPPQGHTHPQQQPVPPTTPGGSYVRTIPIFVEGRSEPIINHKEIPAQYQQAPQQNQPNQQPPHSQTQPPPPPQPQAQQHYQQPQQHQQHQPPQQQQHRPSPLNTEQQIPQQNDGSDQVPPQTPHTMASINKIQDIQRDVLDLMMKVEKFTGVRSDKEYAYLDEMLTRNLLKLDTIDTNGKESIRLARKEAIKCIQASINVLEAKAKGNAKTGITTSVMDNSEQVNEQQNNAPSSNSTSQDEKLDKTNVQEPIPLPPPTHITDESLQNSSSSERTKESSPIKTLEQQREISPSKQNQNNEELSQNSTGTKD